MSQVIDTDELCLIGENPYGFLFDDHAAVPSAQVNLWSVATSPQGRGSVLFLSTSDSQNDGLLVAADNLDLADWLRQEFLPELLPTGSALLDPKATSVEARFERDVRLPEIFRYTVATPWDQVEVAWSEFLPMYSGRTSGSGAQRYSRAASYIPAKSFSLTLSGRRAAGAPRLTERDGRASSSCCLALAETWSLRRAPR